MQEETEVVEVVYSIDYLWKAIVLLAFGLWVGFVLGVATAQGRIEQLAKTRPVINGDVTIRANSKPVTISNMDINANGAEFAVKVEN